MNYPARLHGLVVKLRAAKLLDDLVQRTTGAEGEAIDLYLEGLTIYEAAGRRGRAPASIYQPLNTFCWRAENLVLGSKKSRELQLRALRAKPTRADLRALKQPSIDTAMLIAEIGRAVRSAYPDRADVMMRELERLVTRPA